MIRFFSFNNLTTSIQQSYQFYQLPQCHIGFYHYETLILVSRRIYCPWTNTPLLDAMTELVTDLTTTSKCSTSYFMVSQYCETNKLVTSRLKPRSEPYLCEKISFVDIFSLLDFDIPVEVVMSRSFLSTHSVELVTSFLPVHTFTGCVINDAASFYCLTFTYIYAKIPT